MVTPTGRDAHYDVPLSNFAVTAFNTQDDQFIAQALMPEVPVGKQSDKFYVIERGAFQRIPATERARGTQARRVQFTVTSGSYFANNYALATETPLEDLENADLAIQLRENSTKLVVTNLRRDQEARVAGLVTSISNVGSGFSPSGASLWSAYSSSDPIAQVNTGHAFIRSRTGLTANTMAIDWDTLQVVRRHPAILEMFKYTSAGELNDTQLMQVFKVQRMLIGMGVMENAREGGATSMTNIWGNRVLLAHVGQASGLQSMTFGVRFRWRNPIFPADFGVQTAIENQAGQKKVEILEAGYYQDERIVAPELAYVIDGTL